MKIEEIQPGYTVIIIGVFFLVFGIGLVSYHVSDARNNPYRVLRGSSPPSTTSEPGSDADGNQATQWPIFRGNAAFDGVSSAELSSDLELAWEFPAHGPVRSSPIIVGDTVIVGSINNEDANIGHVYRIDLFNGRAIWEYDAGAPIEAPPLALPALNLVYIGDLDGVFRAIDLRTGEERWKYVTDDKIVGSANIYVASDGRIRVILGSYDAKLHCLDAETGDKIWQYETEDYINGSPAVADGQIFVGGCDAKLHIVNAKDGSPGGFVNLSQHIAATVAVKDGLAYVGHYGNEFVAVNIADKSVEWVFPDRDPFMSAAAVNDEVAVFGSRGRTVFCVDRKTGEMNWSFKSRAGRIESSPVIAGNRVVAASAAGFIYLLDLSSGEELWKYELGADILSSPAVTDGYVVIGGEDGNLYAFKSSRQSSGSE